MSEKREETERARPGERVGADVHFARRAQDQEMARTAALKLTWLVANIASFLGLWCGVSFAEVFEFGGRGARAPTGRAAEKAERSSSQAY